MKGRRGIYQEKKEQILIEHISTFFNLEQLEIQKFMRLTEVYKHELKHKKQHSKKTTKETKQWHRGIQPTQYDYLAKHNEIRSEYHNRQYRNACDLAFQPQAPHPKYLQLYYQDQLTSVNKVFKSLIVRNQLALSDTKLYFQRGQDVLSKFYESFIKDEAITSNLKTVNVETKAKITKFLIAAVSYITFAGFVKSVQLRMGEALALYETGYSICKSIMTSSTNNYKILKTASEFLLCYSAFLLDNSEVDQAIQVLFAALRNQTNIAIILSYRLKNKRKSEVKHVRGELYNRLYAALFNLAQCYQLKKLLYQSYFFLRECELISYLKTESAENEKQIHLGSFLRNLQQASHQHQDLNIIVGAYFNVNQLVSTKKDFKNGIFAQRNQEEAIISEKSILNDGKFIDPPKTKKNFVRRSISLQEKLNQQNNQKMIQEFGQEILFFGVNLFQKKKPKSKNTTKDMRQRQNDSDQNQLSRAYLGSQVTTKGSQQNKMVSKLKKKVKIVKNTDFRVVRQPIQYQVLKKNFQNTWKEQSLQANKTKQSMYMLRYKSQYLNYKQIAKENKHLFEEIQLCNNKQILYRQSTKPVSKKEEESQTGINLFKKILLKHVKKLDIKKTEIIYILKKKSRGQNENLQSLSIASESINFLLQKLKKQKDSYSVQKTRQSNSSELDHGYRVSNLQNVFLTKDTVQIPNLFISYITSEALNFDILAAILEYGMILCKQKQ